MFRALFLVCLLGSQWLVAANVSAAPSIPSCCAGKEARDCARGAPGDAACLPGQGCCIGWIAVLPPIVEPAPLTATPFSFPAFVARGHVLTYPPPLPPPR